MFGKRKSLQITKISAPFFKTNIKYSFLPRWVAREVPTPVNYCFNVTDDNWQLLGTIMGSCAYALRLLCKCVLLQSLCRNCTHVCGNVSFFFLYHLICFYKYKYRIIYILSPFIQLTFHRQYICAYITNTNRTGHVFTFYLDVKSRVYLRDVVSCGCTSVKNVGFLSQITAW